MAQLQTASGVRFRGLYTLIRQTYVVAFVVAVAGFLTTFGCNIDTRQPYRTLNFDQHQQHGNYFGYSVLLHYETDRSWRLLVGAPLADGSHSYRTTAKRAGGLYECKTSKDGDCKIVRMEDNIPTSNLASIVDNPDDGWMGVSLSRQPSRSGDVTVCGHRFRNHYALNQPGADLSDPKTDQYVQGLCYTLYGNDLTVQNRFSPCAQSEAWNGTLRWQGWCQFGISSTYTIDDDETLVVGAVGSFNWTGTTFKQERIGEEDMVNGNLGDWNPDYSYEGFYQYNGYSTSVGHFTSKTAQEGVSGAPRAGGLVGKVYIYDLTDFTIKQELEGEMMNTYFGGAVEALDINNDGYTDLLVGAPLYSRDQDEGRVYVYLNNGRGGSSPLELVQTIDATSTPGARFGSVIKNLGDLNYDKYSDVAIGAPYEGGGVVYIYQGTNNGLDKTYAQRMNGTEMDADVSTFGSSIAGEGNDYDDNFYPDIVIGAYESDSVYMFKTRPLIKINSTITVFPDPLDPENPACKGSDTTCLDIQVCFEYNGPNPGSLPTSVEVIFDLEIDRMKTADGFKPRFKIKLNDTVEMSSKFEDLEETIKKDVKNCYNYTAYLQESATDFLSPMPVDLTYIVKEYDVEPEARGDAPQRFVEGLSPVMESYQCGPITDAEEVTFVRDCGADAICETDIKLSADIEIDGDTGATEIVVGGPSKLFVNAKVDNVGEEAHQAFLVITHALDMPFESLTMQQLSCIDGVTDCVMEQTTVTCEPKQGTNDATVTCNLGNPMKANQAITLRVRFDIGGLIWSSGRNIDVHLEATTSSLQQNDTLADNSKNFPFKLVIEADTGIYGSASPESVYYSSNSSRYADTAAQDKALKEAVGMALMDPLAGNFNDSYIGAPFSLSYQVSNEGSGMLPFQSVLRIHIPWRMIDGAWLVYLKSVSVSSSSVNVDCDADAVLNLQHNRIREVYETKTALSEATQEDVDPLYQEALGAAEEMGCNRAKCVALTCHIEAMQARQFLEIRIEALLWEHTLITREDLSYIEILTEAKMTVTDANVDGYGQGENEAPDQIQLEVTIYTDMEAAGTVPIWVYIVSIIGGILLLLLIIFIMWRCGFFKRKTLEDRIKEQDEAPPKPIKPPMDSGELDGSNMPMMDGPAAQKE